MAKGIRLTISEFVEKALLVHGDKFSYELASYSNAKTKICIICNDHGKFWQFPFNHLSGHACPKCNDECKSKKFSFNQKEWILKAKEVHGNKFDYSKVEYKNSRSFVTIICPIHGKFEQYANSHLQGNGCKKCAIKSNVQNNPMTQEEFITKANKVHFNKYDYSQVEYSSWGEFITIICPEHGEFAQRAGSHLQGFGCPSCCESKGEIRIRQWLIDNNIQFYNQYKFDDCRNIRSLPFDFYLSAYNLCIEFDGIQHFNELEFFGGKEKLLKLQKNDQIKTKYCQDNNIRLIRIPYTDINNIEQILAQAIVL